MNAKIAALPSINCRYVSSVHSNASPSLNSDAATSLIDEIKFIQGFGGLS